MINIYSDVRRQSATDHGHRRPQLRVRFHSSNPMLLTQKQLCALKCVAPAAQTNFPLPSCNRNPECPVFFSCSSSVIFPRTRANLKRSACRRMGISRIVRLRFHVPDHGAESDGLFSDHRCLGRDPLMTLNLKLLIDVEISPSTIFYAFIPLRAW